MNYDITDYISPEEYMEMRKLVEWSAFPLEQAEQGLGRALMNNIMDYIKSQLKPGYRKMVSLKPQSNIYLQDLLVTKKLRSRGTATLLLNTAKEYGKEKGADFFRTQVFPQNKDGLRFYERNGFSLKMLTIECDL